MNDGYSCATCGEPNPARAKFCLECGTALTASAPTTLAPNSPDIVEQLPQLRSGVTGERRMVTVVFADLSGFTAYSEGTDVEDVRAVAGEAADRLSQIVHRYGGTVDKVIGDCVMAVFGAPIAHEDDAERAVRAALEMQACVTENRDRFGGLDLCVGVQSGETLWAPVGPDGRYTVLGDTVNTAARLQGGAQKGQVLIGLPTWDAVAGAIECETTEPIVAKNKADPIPAWIAVSVRAEAVVRPATGTPLVGRDAELERLRGAWHTASSSARPFRVTILGAAGSGKSRLVSALTDAVGGQVQVVRGRCLPYGEGITYWPVVEIIQQMAGIRHDHDQETVQRRLGALLDALDTDGRDELSGIAPALASVMGRPVTPGAATAAPSISRGELHWGLGRALRLATRGRPTIVVFEDVHWAEPALLEFVSSITQARSSGEGAPLLVVDTARPDSDDGTRGRPDEPDRVVIQLSALSPEAARELLSSMLPSEDLADDRITDLLRAAGGNPLFLEETARMWVESGLGTDPSTSLSDLPVPVGIRAIIDARLDRLTSAEQLTVSHAAVIGDVFWEGAVLHLADTDLDLAPSLVRLEEMDLVRGNPESSMAGHREFAFKHGLIRDAAYARLTKAERARLHERFSSWMSTLPGSEQELADIIAFHLEQACTLTGGLISGSTQAPLVPAALALMRASERAEAREGVSEAERYLARAISLVGESLPEKKLELEVRRARLLGGLGRYDEALGTLRAARLEARRLGRTDVEGEALIGLAEILLPLGEFDEGRRHVDDAMALADLTGQTSLRIRALWSKAMIHDSYDNDDVAATEALETALSLAAASGDQSGLLTARMRLGVVHYNNGRLGKAQTALEECLQEGRARGSLRVQAWLEAILGLIRFHCGPRSEADDLLASAAEWMERADDQYMLVQTLVWRATVQSECGSRALAIDLLARADSTARPHGGALAVTAMRHFAASLARAGRSEEVGGLVDEARKLAPESDPGARRDVILIEGLAAASLGDELRARGLFDEALALLEAEDGAAGLGEARLDVAWALERFGDRHGASEQLGLARSLYDRMGAAATVTQIDAHLARLTESQTPNL